LQYDGPEFWQTGLDANVSEAESALLLTLYIVLSGAGFCLVGVGAWKNFRVLGLHPKRTAAEARPWVYGGLAVMAAGMALLIFAPQ
jgi:hypothetical protein